MGFTQKKSDIFRKIKMYSTIANSDIDNQDINTVILNSDDPIEFLLGVIKTSIGENVLEGLVALTLSKVITDKKLNSLSDKVYDSISNNLSENSILPPDIAANGITMPIKSFDLSDSFKKASLSQSAIRNTNKLFETIKDSVLTAANTTVPIPLSNGLEIKIKYDDKKDEINVRLPDVSPYQLFDSLKESIGPMFSRDIIITEILNILFHTDFRDRDKEILTIVRSYTKYESKDVFKLDLKKLLDIDEETNVKGINIDTSCYRENIEITTQQIDAVVAEPTIQKFNELIPEINTDTTTNVKNDYHKNILKTIIDAVISIVLKQPIVVFFINLFNKIINYDFVFDINIPTIVENLKNIFEDIFDKIYKEVYCIIFDYVKNELLKLVLAVTIKFLREKLNRRLQVLISLQGL